MARCLIGCGSNQGRPREQLAAAVELLRSMPGITMLAASRFRTTRPIGGPPGQEPVVNGAFLIETDLPPGDMLGVLMAVENTLDRDRTERWGPRTIDLDLLLYDDVVLDRRDLTVPHPRMSTRRFVLEPCVEIAPDLVHPLAGRTMRELLGNISQAHPHIAVIGVPGSGASEVAAAVADALLARLVRAPLELPVLNDPDFATRWKSALAGCAAAVREESWPDDLHGTVCDFWLGTFLAAAEGRLSTADAEHAYAGLAGATRPPNVVILLLADEAVLEERLAFRRRRSASPTDEAGLSVAATAVADVPAATAAGSAAPLAALQENLRRRLLETGPVPDDRPPAVVAVRADDLTQAMGEAIAAVEAMA